MRTNLQPNLHTQAVRELHTRYWAEVSQAKSLFFRFNQAEFSLGHRTPFRQIHSAVIGRITYTVFCCGLHADFHR
jgi:hypothetical protein